MTPARFTLYDLQTRFWQMHAEYSFTPADTHLYFYLLAQFNAARWPEKMFRKRNEIAAGASIDVKTLDTARTRLEARGLLAYLPGDKVKSAVWTLAYDSVFEGKISLQQQSDSPHMEGKFSPEFRNNPTDSPQMEGKFSPLYKEEEKTTTKEVENTHPIAAAYAEARGEQKKIGDDEKPDNQPISSASHQHTLRGAMSAIADSELLTAADARGAKSAAPKKRTGRVAVAPKQAARPLPDTCGLLAELLNEGGDAALVQQLSEPLSEKQALALLAEFSEPVLLDIFCQMANWNPLLSKASSANLTARNWLRKRGDAAKNVTSNDSAQHHQFNPATTYRGGGYRNQGNGAKPTANAGDFAAALAELD